jgi:hypothetical protein
VDKVDGNNYVRAEEDRVCKPIFEAISVTRHW